MENLSKDRREELTERYERQRRPSSTVPSSRSDDSVHGSPPGTGPGTIHGPGGGSPSGGGPPGGGPRGGGRGRR